MLRKLYTNSGLILVAILAAGVWTSNIQDFLSARKTQEPTRKPTFEELLAQATPQPGPADVDIVSRYDDFDLVVNAPVGATALCRDKTYSFSATKRGACSRHGGVLSWVYGRH
jgi:hypothetical protein